MFQIAKDVLDESQYEMFSQKAIDFELRIHSSDDDVVRRFPVTCSWLAGSRHCCRLITSQIMDFESTNLRVLGDVSMRAKA